MINITSDWKNILQEEFDKEYFNDLFKFIKREYETTTVYPKCENIFSSLNLTPYENVKVVILGQDPYHNVDQAHGLSFSVLPKVSTPPSLMNIYKELKDDLGYEIPNHGYLLNWANQGVLLLNTVLTVREHEANSHQKKGWEKFTDTIIQKLNEKDTPMVFILWGKPASSKKKMLTNERHLIIEAPHPSPLSCYRGFFGSKPFSKSNEYLIQHGMNPIDWRIDKVL